MVPGAEIDVEAVAVMGLDQLEAIFVELGERHGAAVEVIENAETKGH